MKVALDQAAWRKSSYSGQSQNCVEVATWRKSSHSGQAGSCVEVATWRKSSHSAQVQNCIEVGGAPTGAVAVRDSKDPDGLALVFAPAAWLVLARRVKGGELP